MRWTPPRASDRPYTASERNYSIEMLQPKGPNRYAVFFAHARESVDFHYERTMYEMLGNALVDPKAPPPPGSTRAADPRVTHVVTLQVDPWGNVLRSVSLGYGDRKSVV